MATSSPSSSWIISPLSDLTPPSLERTWQTAPHPNLPLAATSSADKTVRIYSLVNYKLLSTVTGGHKRSVRSCAWKPGDIKGESVLATGSFDATVGVWRRWNSYGQEGEDGEGGRPRRHDIDEEEGEEEDEEWRFAVLLDGHDSEVKSVSWSASGSLLATCSRDKSIWIWEDLDDGDNNFETVAVLQEHSADVKCVSWHPSEGCLASGSYDDTIRIWREDIDDWGQVACLEGHTGTVWFIDWEPVDYAPDTNNNSNIKEEWKEHYKLSGPRLVSCSADNTVRVWRRQGKEQQQNAYAANTGIPSIIRPTGLDETWYEDAILPATHDLAIYSVAWSKRSGLIASTGADGRIVVYEERVLLDSKKQEEDSMDTDPPSNEPKYSSEWKVVATVEAAHGIYEINHVTWAKRADRESQRDGREGKEEEILISTADDGSVKVWSIKRGEE
ncbi:putative cytosolic iron-sulfur protein assembly protein 1 [Talaromyces atroroseus]|uniref:Probable cytosolic iron-sulfur protein assembly protein 1 n=1 Tax=Talaromyces atroroseus TaxID=1441469 RepID=A0A1Q5Q8U9_TALAT|nr:putative cytosolic iron-sulfur protein assembly protein 1 [Talaromyces atroroseus]OKL60535.1 putative cytosolic iron-sulfur protein assembly protein 1 [Talaromyces atroroseus]